MIKGGKWLQQLDKRHSVLGHRVLGGCWWPLQIHARSNRNAGRHHRGFAGDFPRNPQASFSVARIVKCSPKTLRKRYRDDLDFGVAEANAIVSGLLFAAANVVAQMRGSAGDPSLARVLPPEIVVPIAYAAMDWRSWKTDPQGPAYPQGTAEEISSREARPASTAARVIHLGPPDDELGYAAKEPK